MTRRLLPIVLISLLAATSAEAQIGGGGSGGGRHGGGHRGGGQPSGDGSSPAPGGAPIPRQKPANEIEIIGVVKAIAPDTDRITIAYEAVEALNWPAGAMPFVVAKSALLKDVTVGEKVRFKLDSQQISALTPF
jgi:Cu/Ag efflux protein CusF